MSRCKLLNIKPFQEVNADRTYLVLIAIHNIPPHFAMISNNKYYSLSSKGVKLGVNSDLIINSLSRKKVPSIMIDLKGNISNTLIHNIYSNFEHLRSGESCLTPIKSVLSNFDQEVIKSKYAFDLINLLQSKNIIEEVLSLNYNKTNFELLEYGQQEIDLAIFNAAQLC